ncbi:hypothetical protein [Brevibacillus porteri]|uniref:hypothetical protein n=1 Tax=Brevibacillus porteri TaxID=2126350 RepID=UPI003D1ACF80
MFLIFVSCASCSITPILVAIIYDHKHQAQLIPALPRATATTVVKGLDRGGSLTPKQVS